MNVALNVVTSFLNYTVWIYFKMAVSKGQL